MGEPAMDLHWSPHAGGAPVFQPFRADEATLRCLTRTQVALHTQQLQYNALLKAARRNEEQWDKERALLVGAQGGYWWQGGCSYDGAYRSRHGSPPASALTITTPTSSYHVASPRPHPPPPSITTLTGSHV